MLNKKIKEISASVSFHFEHSMSFSYKVQAKVQITQTIKQENTTDRESNIWIVMIFVKLYCYKSDWF